MSEFLLGERDRRSSRRAPGRSRFRFLEDCWAEVRADILSTGVFRLPRTGGADLGVPRPARRVG